MNTFSSLRVDAHEGATVEFKTSLFFSAGSSAFDNEQMNVITRTIGSMMNKAGGSLYVGVNDKGYASTDIFAEMQYLNLNSPYPRNYYPATLDGYKRFIMDWVCKNLGNFAATLVSLEFLRYVNIVVCRIDIEKSKVPIWFDHTELYVRTDASSRHLKGDEITSFIMQIDKAEFAKARESAEESFNKRLEEIKKAEAPSGRMLVVYPNGEYIHERSNKATMLEVVRRAGVEEVRKLYITGHKGRGKTPYVPFISTSQYFDKSGKTQDLMDGYWVLTKIGVGEMLSIVTQISNGLGLNLHVESF